MADNAPPADTPAPEAPPAPVTDPAAPPAAVAGDPPKPDDAAPDAEPPKPADPPKADDPPAYSLALPKDSGLDPAVIEKTAAISRELGLSQEHAQKTLDFVSQQASDAAKAATDATIQSYAPGGAAWEAQQTEWKTAALADPDLGAGKPEALAANVLLAKQVVAKFGGADTPEFFEKSGLGSNPTALKLLANIGKAMSEDQLVIPSAATPAKSAAEKLYDNTPATS